MKEDILKAKRKLYSLLIKLDENIITNNELDIMLLLSKDDQIQELFDNKNNCTDSSLIYNDNKHSYPIEAEYNLKFLKNEKRY